MPKHGGSPVAPTAHPINIMIFPCDSVACCLVVGDGFHLVGKWQYGENFFSGGAVN